MHLYGRMKKTNNEKTIAFGLPEGWRPKKAFYVSGIEYYNAVANTSNTVCQFALITGAGVSIIAKEGDRFMMNVSYVGF